MLIGVFTSITYIKSLFFLSISLRYSLFHPLFLYRPSYSHCLKRSLFFCIPLFFTYYISLSSFLFLRLASFSVTLYSPLYELLSVSFFSLFPSLSFSVSLLYIPLISIFSILPHFLSAYLSFSVSLFLYVSSYISHFSFSISGSIVFTVSLFSSLDSSLSSSSRFRCLSFSLIHSVRLYLFLLLIVISIFNSVVQQLLPFFSPTPRRSVSIFISLSSSFSRVFLSIFLSPHLSL